MSGRRDNKAVVWILKTLKQGITFEMLANSGCRFYRIDVAIGAAFMRRATGTLRTIFRLAAERATMHGELIKGRQLLDSERKAQA